MKLHADFETRSALDLTVVGLLNYVRHPSTEAWCMSWYFDGDPDVSIWIEGQPLPERIRNHVLAGGVLSGHNVGFEHAVWNEIMAKRHGWPPLLLDQCDCTMIRAYEMGLPASLENASAGVGLHIQKDTKGHRLMMQMARPQRTIETDSGPLYIWWNDPEKLQQLYDYCIQDTRVEVELDKRLLQLSARERQLWVLDQKINKRGIYVDIPTIEGAIDIVRTEQEKLAAKMREATGGQVQSATEVAKLTKWIRAQGVDIPGLAKADVIDALDGELPAQVKAALKVRQEAGQTSTAKLVAMKEAADVRGRITDTMQMYGANSTGRWAGRRIQPHNMKRPTIPQELIERLMPYIARRDIAMLEAVGSPMDLIASCMRAMICAAPGNELLTLDFSNIEGRVIAWLAGEDWKLDAFRAQDDGTGPEIYLVAAAKIYDTSPDNYDKKSPERQIGKVSELACGYQGGVGAFQTMAKTYNVKVEDSLASYIKDMWRQAHPATVQYWWDLENAAIQALLNPGKIYAAGARQTHYVKSGSFLFAKLPSDRVLVYPYPKLMMVDTPWGEPKEAVTYMTMVDPSKKEKIIYDPYSKGRWQRVSTYGGKLAENNTQAVSRDLLADALIRVDALGYPIVFHVHDEIVCELPIGIGKLDTMRSAMEQTEPWAFGIPVVADGWIGKRYRKG